MEIPVLLLPHSIDLEPLLGHYSQGAMYGDLVTISKCYIEEKVTMVRDSKGAEVVSSGFVIIPLNAVNEIPVDSRVIVRGQQRVVLTVARFDGGGLLPIPDHFQVYLK